MRTLCSIRWVLVVSLSLSAAAGCDSNESNINTQGTTTAPEAVTSTDEMLKKGATPQKPTAPSSYPGAGRRR
jgi:hypothetical protein